MTLYKRAVSIYGPGSAALPVFLHYIKLTSTLKAWAEIFHDMALWMMMYLRLSNNDSSCSPHAWCEECSYFLNVNKQHLEWVTNKTCCELPTSVKTKKRVCGRTDLRDRCSSLNQSRCSTVSLHGHCGLFLCFHGNHLHPVKSWGYWLPLGELCHPISCNKTYG